MGFQLGREGSQGGQETEIKREKIPSMGESQRKLLEQREEVSYLCDSKETRVTGLNGSSIRGSVKLERKGEGDYVGL